MRWGELHAEVLAAIGSPAEARWLIEEASGGSWPAVRPEPVTERLAARLSDMVERRLAGEPLQYVLGHWAFRTLDLMVDRRVLIPRPETEITTEVALAALDPAAPATVVDLGTGSGAIALAIAVEHPHAELWATDLSEAALAVASANLAGLAGRAATRVRLAAGRWWDALPSDLAGTVDLVVSNPPYITSAEMADLDPVVSGWEPHSALEAGPSGLEDVAEVVGGAARWLRPGGAVVVEIAPHQEREALELAAGGGLVGGRVAEDLAGRPRVLVARRPS